MKKFIPFVIVFLLVFYALPYAFYSEILLLAAMQGILLITGIVFGGIYGFSIIFSALCILCALPLILSGGIMFFIWIVAFFVVASLGNLLGLIFRKKVK